MKTTEVSFKIFILLGLTFFIMWKFLLMEKTKLKFPSYIFRLSQWSCETINNIKSLEVCIENCCAIYCKKLNWTSTALLKGYILHKDKIFQINELHLKTW